MRWVDRRWVHQQRVEAIHIAPACQQHSAKRKQEVQSHDPPAPGSVLAFTLKARPHKRVGWAFLLS